jgi:tRNA nucleotidyltransferase (CCA-adding enzyme)
VVRLIEVHDVVLKPDRKVAKRLLNKLGLAQCLQLVRFQKLDKKCHRWNTSDEYAKWCQGVEDLCKIWNNIIDSREAFMVSDLAINGNDLIEMGFKQGKSIGITLGNCLEYVMENPDKNDKTELKRFILSSMIDMKA